jgi:uncharacterized protein
MRAFNHSTGIDLATNLLVAETLFSRGKGLLGRESLPPGEGLLIRPCMAVHTFLMKFPIDVVFLDQENRVLKAVQNLQPHRISSIVPTSAGVIELPAGTVQRTGTAAGNQIMIS